MTTTLVEGITIHSAAEGAAIQSAKVTAKSTAALVSATVSGKTQVTKVFSHTDTIAFSVTGKGDLTMTSGLGATLNLSLITAGISPVDEFDYEQKVGDSSSWTYSGNNYPHAA